MTLSEMQALRLTWRKAIIEAEEATLWGNTKQQRAAWAIAEQATQAIEQQLGISPDELEAQVNAMEADNAN